MLNDRLRRLAGRWRWPRLQPSLEEEGAFVDLVLAVASVERQADGYVVIEAMALRGWVSAGFVVTVPGVVNAGLLTGGDGEITSTAPVPGGIRLRRHGSAGDRFVESLAEFYSMPQAGLRMHDTVDAAAINLSTLPQHILSESIKMKLFLNIDGPDENYAECYLNLDLPNRRVEFREKDPGYRVPLLKAMAEPWQP